MKNLISTSLKTIAILGGLMLTAPTSAHAQQCAAGFTYSVNGQTVTFTNTSTSFSNYTYWQWNMGDNTYDASVNPSHTYQYGGTYVVCLTMWDSIPYCSSTFCDSFTIVGPPPPCNASFWSFQSTGLDTTFFYSSSSNVTMNTQYSWTFGDNTSATGQNVIHSYNSPGNYYVCLYISDNSTGCSDSYCQYVYSGPWTSSCTADFTWTTNVSTASFTNTSSGITNQTGFYWNFGDGNWDYTQSPTHTYQYAGTYNVCLNIWDSIQSCQSSVCYNVTVGGQPQPCNAFFTMWPDSNNQYNYWAYNQSTGSNPMSYTWNWGDGSPDDYTAYPSHTYTNPGLYNICLSLTAGNGCTSSYCNALQVRLASSTQNAPVTINVINPNPSGVQEQQAGKEFSLYPNPATDFLRVNGKDLAEAKFTICDVLGNSILTGVIQNNSITVDQLARGVYILKIENRTAKRFIKE